MNRIIIFSLLYAAVSLTANAASLELGKMTRFYRGQAVLGEFLSEGGLQPGETFAGFPPT